MRRVTLLLVLVVALAGGGLVIVSRPELLNVVGLGGDVGLLRMIALSFLEDIQFKDFLKAATYHSPEEQDSVDIPFLLERLFHIKPELLDIMSYEIVFVKVDQSGLRARVKARIKVKFLLNGSLREKEMMLYFHRKTLKAPWRMKLESSLRNLSGQEGKKY